MNLSVESLAGEVWRPIAGYEGLYEASSFGRIKSLPRSWLGNFGVRASKTKILKQSEQSGGYLNVSLSKDNKAKTYTVHKLVAIAFHGEGGDRRAVRHLDGNTKNNQPCNLQWGTYSENEADKALHGTAPIGEKNPFAKLTEATVREIRSRIANGEGVRTVADSFGISKVHASQIAAGKRWGHIPMEAM
jgi:hypothetical protein